jgi:hypothetical protein
VGLVYASSIRPRFHSKQPSGYMSSLHFPPARNPDQMTSLNTAGVQEP